MRFQHIRVLKVVPVLTFALLLLWLIQSKISVRMIINNQVSQTNQSNFHAVKEVRQRKKQRCPPDVELEKNAARWREQMLQACRGNSELVAKFNKYRHSLYGYKRMAYVRKEWKVAYFGIHKNGHTSIQVYLYHWNRTEPSKIENITAAQIGKTIFYTHTTSHLVSWEQDKPWKEWSDYFKFTFVQEPLVRIVAGFLERLYYKPPGEDGEDTIFRLTRPELNKTDFISKTYWLEPQNRPKLVELFQYLANVNNPKNENAHWLPQFLIWLFCQKEQFDFVGKMNNIACEMEYIARNRNFSGQVPKFFRYENRMKAEQRANFLRTIPSELARKVIMKHYILDYKIFGFQMPDFDNWNSTVNRIFGITQ